MPTRKQSFPKTGQPIELRTATHDDIAGILALTDSEYGGAGMGTYTEGEIRGQISQFPEGQLVVVVDARVIGYCATFMVAGEIALQPHTWDGITGNGYASRHDHDGDYLYGMEVCVDPEYQGFRIGQRLYNARKQLCVRRGLKGIVFGGRIPTLHRRIRQYPEVADYIEQVRTKVHRDPVLSFQLRNGFEAIGVLPRYIPDDHESLGYAVHLLWRNREVPDAADGPVAPTYEAQRKDTVRVATIQYLQRRVETFEEFLGIVEYFVDTVSDYKADFAVFPEMFSLQLLSMDEEAHTPREAIEALTAYTPRLKDAMRDMALKYNVNIIGGSHPTIMANGRVENVCYVFLRDGRIAEQAKIHPTPNEVEWWNIEGGSTLSPIETDCGTIGVLICYDSEFPELARHLVDQGAMILFVPFCTDERQSYLRVRYCSQARAVENQCFVAMAGNVGNLPRVENMDIQYAQSCILTPCDFPFARDGIAADTTPNVEAVALADLRLDALRQARYDGTVRNLRDRRHDLYRVEFKRSARPAAARPPSRDVLGPDAAGPETSSP